MPHTKEKPYNMIRATHSTTLNISWKQKRINASILCELDTERQLLGKIISLKLGYFGNILRGSGSPLTLGIIEGKAEGKTKRGRQKKNWFDSIREWTSFNYTSKLNVQPKTEVRGGGVLRRVLMWSPIVISDEAVRQGKVLLLFNL